MYLLVPALAALAALGQASSGDRLPEFGRCLDQCTETCPRDMGLLRLLLWTCEADCDYECQQLLTSQQLAAGARLHQYHGKWPFVRMLGVQEPASVVFSMANFYANYKGLELLAPFHGPLAAIYKAMAFVGMNTWVWSSVFHVRDYLITERLDYFSAIFSIFFGLFVVLVRTFSLGRQAKLGVAACLGAFYLYHILYLSLVKFDYGYNMLVGVVAGLIQNALWVGTSIANWRRTKDRRDLMPIGLVVALFAGMSFELFDFSPLWLVFDAHSLWHAATVVPTYLWFKYMSFDLNRRTKLD